MNKLEWDILINDLSGREGKLEFGLCKKRGKVVSSFFFLASRNVSLNKTMFRCHFLLQIGRD